MPKSRSPSDSALAVCGCSSYWPRGWIMLSQDSCPKGVREATSTGKKQPRFLSSNQLAKGQQKAHRTKPFPACRYRLVRARSTLQRAVMAPTRSDREAAFAHCGPGESNHAMGVYQQMRQPHGVSLRGYDPGVIQNRIDKSRAKVLCSKSWPIDVMVGATGRQ